MKKIFVLALVLLLGMTACGKTGPEATADIPVPTFQTEPVETSGVSAEEGYSFLLKEISLMPGAVFDESKMPEHNGRFEIPSYTHNGADILYNYNVVEVTVTEAGEEPLIYAITLMDPNTATDEGLYLNDDAATVKSIYGTDCKEENNTLIYEKGNTQLRITIVNDAVFHIEYRMITL